MKTRDSQMKRSISELTILGAPQHLKRLFMLEALILVTVLLKFLSDNSAKIKQQLRYVPKKS